MSTTKFENVGSPQMVLRLLGGLHMLRKGDTVELDEIQVKHESVRSAIASGDLVEVAEAAPVVEAKSTGKATRVKAADAAPAPAEVPAADKAE